MPPTLTNDVHQIYKRSPVINLDIGSTGDTSNTVATYAMWLNTVLLSCLISCAFGGRKDEGHTIIVGGGGDDGGDDDGGFGFKRRSDLEHHARSVDEQPPPPHTNLFAEYVADFNRR